MDKYKQLKEELGSGSRMTDLDAFDIPINWEDLRSNQIISYDACDILETFTKAAESDRLSLIADNTERTRLAAAFTSVVVKTAKTDILQKTLALAWRAMTESQKLVFHANQQTKTVDITPNLLALLNRSKDEYVLGKAASVVSKIIQAGFADPKQVSTFNSWVLDNMLSAKDDLLVDILVATKNALYNKKFQELFVKSHGSTMHLYKTYQKHPNHRQIIYLTIFCYWLLTFDEKNHTHDRLIKPNLFQMLVNALSDRLKPKIVRVALMFFENLLGSKQARELMVMKGLVSVLERLQKSEKEKGTDPDIKNSLEVLVGTLAKDVKQMSSFEQYEKEIMTGQLQKGPVHSTGFWKSNARKFEKKEFAMIKKLIELLAVTDDNETVATALYDLGEFARFYPRGRELLDALHGRERVLYHLSSENKQIQEQALLAVQKLLVKGMNSAGANRGQMMEEEKE